MTNIHDGGIPQPPAQEALHAERDDSPQAESQDEAPVSKKRKAGADLPGHVDKKAFTLRPYPPSIYGKPCTLKSSHLLERSKLPLCYLDTTSTSSPISQSRFFSSHIDALESSQPEQENASSHRPVLLIARMDSDKSMYAIERVDKDTYALCKLAHWVSAKDLRGDSAGKIVGRVPLLPISHNTCAKGKNVESNAKEKALDKPVIEAPNRNVPTDGAKSDGKHSTTTSHPLRHSEQLVSQVNDVETGLDPRSPELPEELPERLLTARQIFERLLCQYMETLYLSKASLTFFTKGPLSKARVAFTSSNQPLDMSELAEFLRSLCLTSSAMEKKYREKLVGIVKDAPILAISDEDVPANSPLRRKPAKRLHPTKAGMFPFEEDFVKRWWSSDDSSPSRRRADETAETMMRRRLASLRLRETLIQVILLLETLAFETSPAFMAKKANENAQSLKETGSEGTEPKPDKKPKSSAKAQDLTLALDIVVDKLCIWQSVEQDTHTSLITPQKDDKREASRSTPLRGTGSDLLRDFYSEVILPFYMSRLPQQVSALGRKLGVHPGPSPAKHSAVKPGSSVVRKPPQVSSVSSGKLGDEKLPRKSLHQVATETSAQKPTKTPTLVRFASDSAAVPGLKRERSQTPSLLSIPLAEGGSQGSARGSLAHFKRLSKREVDLSALSAANEAKLRKKASVQEQLKNAISALKKPNRVAAVKENVDFIERRSSGKGPQGVQIGATPKRTNKFSAVATPKQTSKSAAAMEFSALPRSSFIPSSAIRRGPDAEAVESAHRRNFGVQDTPSRGPGRMAAFLNRHMSHSVMNRGDDHSDVQKPDHAVMTPSRPRHKDVMEYNDGEEPEVFLTPLKRMAGPAILDDEMGGNEKTQRGSIYDALGWNDDVDDLA